MSERQLPCSECPNMTEGDCSMRCEVWERAYSYLQETIGERESLAFSAGAEKGRKWAASEIKRLEIALRDAETEICALHEFNKSLNDENERGREKNDNLLEAYNELMGKNEQLHERLRVIEKREKNNGT